jgi:benzoate/toluate 1,2-dioxygenase beta subunit
VIGNVTVEEADNEAGTYVIGSRFQMVEFRRDAQRVFAGASRHRLERRDGVFMIRWKRVDLVNCDGMIEGITIPF